MASLLSEYEYDIFISYRQNDNKYDGWVTKFVEKLQEELEATIKATITIYFDENPHDGLLDTHLVDESLSIKLKSLMFIPIVSQTYCDPNCYAWQYELLPFIEMTENDELGRYVKLASGNVSSRILPIRIHKLDEDDQQLLEDKLGGPIRAIDFVYEAPGINRPLDSIRDDKYSGENKIIYRDQINKVANSIKEILIGIKQTQEEEKKEKVRHKEANLEDIDSGVEEKFSFRLWGKSFLRRNIPQVILAYVMLSMVLFRILNSMVSLYSWPGWLPLISVIFLSLGGITAVVFAWYYEFSPEGFIRTKSWESRLNPYPGYKRKPLTGIVTISALVLILVLQSFYTDFFFAKTNEDKSYNKRAIAVLPFIDDADSTGKSNFSSDLTQNITYRLSKIRTLDVIAPDKYDPERISLQQFGNDYNVNVLLRGNVRRFGNQLRIICQLLDIETGQVLWMDIYSKEIEDLFRIQSEVVQHIVEKLEADFSKVERINLIKDPTRSIIAYEHYLKGRELYNKNNRESNVLAINEFKYAIRLDSTYSLAWAGLADAFGRNHVFQEGKNWSDSSVNAALKAVELNPSSEVVYKALGNAYYYDLQYDKAFKQYHKAIEINPNYSPAIGNIGSMYFVEGKFDEAIRWQFKSAELNPYSPYPYNIIGWSYRSIGDLLNAQKWLERSLDVDIVADTYRELGYTFVQQGMNEKAINLIPKVIAIDTESSKSYEEAGLIALFANDLYSTKMCFDKAFKLNNHLITDPNSLTPIALVFLNITSGEYKESATELERLESMYLDIISGGSEDDDHRIYLAAIKMMQGKDNEAIQWIKRALESNWYDVAEIDYLPWFEPLRTNPEYLKIIAPLKARLLEMRQKVENLE